MNWIGEIKKIWVNEPETKKLQKFGLLIGGLVIVLGFLIELDLIIFFGTTILGLGLIKPFYLGTIYKLWMSLSVIMSHITGQLTLLTIFIFVMIPVGLLRNLLHDQSISKVFDKKKRSYWEKYNGTNQI